MGSVLAEPAHPYMERIEAIRSLFLSCQLGEARLRCDQLIDEVRLAAPVTRDAVHTHAAYWALRCARRQDRPDEALKMAYSALAAARRAQLERMECFVLGEFVRILGQLGQHRDAFAEADAALERAASCDVQSRAAVSEAFAGLYWRTENWRPGLLAYQTAWQLAEQCGHAELRVLSVLGLAAMEEGLSAVEREAGDVQLADAHAQRSFDLQHMACRMAADAGDHHLVMYGELNKGCSLHTMGRFEEAKAVFTACLARPEYASVHGNAFSVLGRIAQDQQRPEEALVHLTQALRLTESSNKAIVRLLALKTLVETHESLGDLASALACMRNFHAQHVRNASEKTRLLAEAMGIKHRTENALAMAQQQRQRADDLQRRNESLVSQMEQHALDALQDSLTGLANRRRFDQVREAAHATHQKAARSSVALVDLDHFKMINDRYSHRVGDEVLRRIGGLMLSHCRRNDLAARVGGEEFVLLVADVGREQLRQIAERLRQAVENTDWAGLHPDLQVTVSIGIAHHDELEAQSVPGIDALMALADARLYVAKSTGRNRVTEVEPQGGRLGNA